MLARNVFDTFATHFGLVHDVTDTDCWPQYGSTHGYVFAIFKKFGTNIPVDKARDAASAWFPFNLW